MVARLFSRPSQLAALIAALVLFAGCATLPKARVPLESLAPAQRVQAEQNLRVFNAVWDLVNRKHYQPKPDGLDWEQSAARYAPRAAAASDSVALYEVLNDMLEELHDSHTRALSPPEVAERRTHERARTGFSMTRIEDTWVVADVLPGSPAAIAGVSPGWIVRSYNGIALGGRPVFRPREGEEVRWLFVDPHDRLVPLTLQARTLSTAPLQVIRELPGGIIYLRFDEFDSTDRRWLSQQLRDHANAPAVVVDLRRNPGGDTRSLGISIGEFFDHPVDCGTFITRRGARSVKNSWQLGSARYRGKVAVLVDASSASSAEIFSVVLKDQRRAVIIGRKTAGAVLASWFYHLPDEGELQLSEDDYVAPNGRRIESNGVEPDVVVTRTLADLRAGRDPDLDAALAVLRDQLGHR